MDRRPFELPEIDDAGDCRGTKRVIIQTADLAGDKHDVELVRLLDLGDALCRRLW